MFFGGEGERGVEGRGSGSGVLDGTLRPLIWRAYLERSIIVC